MWSIPQPPKPRPKPRPHLATEQTFHPKSPPNSAESQGWINTVSESQVLLTLRNRTLIKGFVPHPNGIPCQTPCGKDSQFFPFSCRPRVRLEEKFEHRLPLHAILNVAVTHRHIGTMEAIVRLNGIDISDRPVQSEP
jgi:hypothetical protein